MTSFQKAVKYFAYAVAALLIVAILTSIIRFTGVVNKVSDDDYTLAESVKYSISSDVKSIDISIAAADFSIVQAESFSIVSNLKNITVDDSNGVLKVREEKSIGLTTNDAELILYLPTDIVLKSADINSGFGRLVVDCLKADDLNLSLGAGEVNISELHAINKATINGGAGKTTINGGTLNNLDFEMGVGELDLTSALIGESELEFGVGKTRLTLIGSQNDYSIDVDEGIGDIKINGVSFSKDKVYGNGGNSVSIDGGVGSIDVFFQN